VSYRTLALSSKAYLIKIKLLLQTLFHTVINSATSFTNISTYIASSNFHENMHELNHLKFQALCITFQAYFILMLETFSINLS